MKIIVWHTKYGRRHFAADTPAQKEKAMWTMFKEMDENDYYWELAHSEPEPELPPGYEYTDERTRQRVRDSKDEVLAYRGAKAGAYGAVKWLLEMRNDYEYEGWDIEEIEE